MIPASSSTGAAERPSRASWQRRLLACFLDYLLFGVPWALVVWSLGKTLPSTLSFLIGLAVFMGLEALLLQVGWSPGHWLLGIRRVVVADPLAASGTRSSWIVDPWLKSNEKWWTMLFGVLAILDGAKSLVRWSMWTPPIPFLGFQLDEATSAWVLVALGVFECAIGWAALRLRQELLPVGLTYYVLTIGSTLLSWRLWPAWVEKYTLARRAYQGLPLRDGEVELMQRLIPGSMVVGGILLGLWMLLVAWRIHRARTAAVDTGSSCSR